MSHLAHLVSSAFNVREVSPLCTCYECNKARSRATSAADVYLVAQPVGLPEQEVPRIQAESWERSRNRPEPTGFEPSVTNFLSLPCPDRNTLSKGPAPCTCSLGDPFPNQGRHSHGGDILATCVMWGSHGA